jgi:ribonuclease HI
MYQHHDAEMAALQTAAEWMETQTQQTNGKICICTDSQAAVTALNNGGATRPSLNKSLRRAGVRTILQWIPGHVEIPGNDAAYRLAKEASGEPLPSHAIPFPISFEAAKARARQFSSPPPPTHERIKATYADFRPSHRVVRER